MKLTIERAAFLKSLGHVQSVVERRNTILILSNVKMEAGDNRLCLNATDLDLDVIESVEAEVGTPGATTAPAHTLYDIVRKLPEGSQIEIEQGGEDGHLILVSGTDGAFPWPRPSLSRRGPGVVRRAPARRPNHGP